MGDSTRRRRVSRRERWAWSGAWGWRGELPDARGLGQLELGQDGALGAGELGALAEGPGGAGEGAELDAFQLLAEAWPGVAAGGLEVGLGLDGPLVGAQQPAGRDAQVAVEPRLGGQYSAQLGPLGRAELVGAGDRLGELGQQPGADGGVAVGLLGVVADDEAVVAAPEEPAVLRRGEAAVGHPDDPGQGPVPQVGLDLADQGLVAGVARPAPHPHWDAGAGDRHADHDLRQVVAVVLGVAVAAKPYPGHILSRGGVAALGQPV